MTAAEQSAYLSELTRRWHVGGSLYYEQMEHVLYLARLGCVYLIELERQQADTARVWARVGQP